MRNINYRNTTLGRNLLDTTQNKITRFNDRAFLFDPDEKKIGMMTNEYCYMKNLLTGKENFVSSKSNDALPMNTSIQEDKKLLQDLTNAYYETAKYMLLNNKKAASH